MKRPFFHCYLMVLIVNPYCNAALLPGHTNQTKVHSLAHITNANLRFFILIFYYNNSSLQSGSFRAYSFSSPNTTHDTTRTFPRPYVFV